MRAVTALVKSVHEATVAQEVNYQDEDVEQFYEDMHPGPNACWKEQWLSIISAMNRILGMSKYMDTFNAAASYTNSGFANLVTAVKHMVEEASTQAWQAENWLHIPSGCWSLGAS